MKTITARALIIALAMFLAACGSKLTQENFNKISSGMPYAEVVKILGEPQKSEGSGLLGMSATTALWKDDQHQVSIIFINEKVASKNFEAVITTRK